MKTISVASGCFNEAGNIEEFIVRVRTALRQFPQYEYEIVIADNSSTDGTQETLRRLASEDRNLKVILNARNFGWIRSGYNAVIHTKGDAVLCLASDLQDPPELIPQFLQKWEEGYKAVVGIKAESEESAIFFFIRKCYYRLVDRLADIDIIQNHTGFGCYDKAIIDYCRELRDPYPYFRGLISEIGFPVARIPFVQPKRKRGITKGNFYMLYDVAMLGITNHSKVPLRLAAMMGFAMSLLSLLVAVAYFLYKLVNWYQFPIGQAPVIIGLFLFSSVQLFFIGIVGEYIGAIHTQVLKRPLVVEKERINF